MEDKWPREKRWKAMYTRSAKVVRGRQLGFEYPRVSKDEAAREAGDGVQDERLNLLFVCSKNQWRSPTAEAVWRKHPMVSVRSVGTASSARRQISAEDPRYQAQVLHPDEILTRGYYSQGRVVVGHRTGAKLELAKVLIGHA